MAPTVVVTNFAFLGPVEYWALAAAFLLLFVMGLFIFLIYAAKKTHMVQEIKGIFSGKRLVLFFDDNRTVEWRSKKPSSGLIEDDDYGTFLINEKGTYVDKKTRNILIPFSTNLAVGASVKDFKASDDLLKILGDERELQKVRMALANGETDFNNLDFGTLRESVNFSSLKSLANTLIPHNITAKINMEIAKRMKSFGAVNGKQMIMYILLILGAVGLMALVLWLTLGGKGGTTTNVYQTGAAMANLSGHVISG